MPVQITIRGVPEEVRDELALRAARQHQSMQEFLRCELERIASRPSVGTWLQEVRTRKQATGNARSLPPTSCAHVDAGPDLTTVIDSSVLVATLIGLRS